MYANVVLGHSTEKFEKVLHRVKTEKGYTHDFEVRNHPTPTRMP